ncbi:MAG: hypothetical protein IPP88_14005 [Betaproteobacteria bacterium]|nr:hypothetical protein [Betaproteobacteria bacterium]
MAVCTTDPIPSLQQESMAKRFEGDPSRQIVWVVRNAKYDAYDKVSVSVNGIQIKMLHDTVARFALMPGSHHITALHRSSEVGKLAIDGKAGEQIFVEVHPDIGIFSTDFSLRQLSDEEGRRKVLASKLILDQQIGSSL